MSSKKRRREEKKKKRKVRFVFGRGIINGVKLIALSLSLSLWLETGIGDIFLIHERLMRASNRVVLSFPVAGERW